MRCPFADRIAPIAISMTVVGPGTIGPHPWAGMKWRAADSRFFDFAMQSRPIGRRRKKADDGRCGIEIKAAISPPVFGQTRSIEFALGVIFVSGNGQPRHGYHRRPHLPVDKGFPGSRATGSRSHVGAANVFRRSTERALWAGLSLFSTSPRSGRDGRATGMVATAHSAKLDDPRFVVELAWMAWTEALDCLSARCGTAFCICQSPPACTDGGRPTHEICRLAYRFHDFIALEDGAHTVIEQG